MMLFTQPLSDRGWQPPSVNPAAPASAPRSTLRRCWRRRLMELSFFGGDDITAGDHRTHVVGEPRKDDHRNVNKREADQSESKNKMDGTGGLAAAENRHQERKARIKARRHRHAGQDHDRYRDEDDGEIGQLLQHVVTPRLVPLRKAKPDVLPDVVRNIAPFARTRPEIAADVPRCKGKNQIDK